MKLRLIPRVVGAPRYLSYSELAAFRSCKFKWWVEYVLGVRSAGSSAATRLGSLVDAALMAKLRMWSICKGTEAEGELDPEAAIRKECQRNSWPDGNPKYGSTEEAAEKALAIADRVYEELDIDSDRWKPLAIGGKAAIQISLYTPLEVPEGSAALTYYTGGFKGKVDWLVYDGAYDGRPVAVDFKVKKTIVPSQDLGADLQLALYQHLAAANDCRVMLAEQIQILGKVPGVPTLTSKRKLSTDSKQCVSYETFTAAMKRLGHPEIWYTKHLDRLKKRRFLQIVMGSAPPSEVAALWGEAMAEAELMARIALSPPERWTRGSPLLATRLLDNYAGSKCSNCSLHSLCRTTIAGRPTVSDAIKASLESEVEVA